MIKSFGFSDQNYIQIAACKERPYKEVVHPYRQVHNKNLNE